MKKIKSIPVYLLSIIYFTMFIVSCSDDNPVTSPEGPYQFDSARYEWKVDTLPNSYAFKVFGFDSSHIFILDPFFLITYDGSIYSKYNLNNIFFSDIDGKDPNNLFIAGGSREDGSYRMVKWNGTSLIKIDAPFDTGQLFGLISIFVKSTNEIYLGAKGKIFFYDGISYTKYQIDTTLDFIDFTEDESGRILATGFKYICQIPHIYCGKETVIYLFTDSNWTKISTVSTPYSTPQFSPGIVGKRLYGSMADGVFEFRDNSFTKIINSPSEHTIGTSFGGEDREDLMFVAFKDGYTFLTNWNGLKWSNEYPDRAGIISITNINNSYYAIGLYCALCSNRLIYIGKKQ